MKTDWLKTRQTRYTAYATVYIAIILAVLGVVNFLANRHTKSWDSTANKRFSLSDQTGKVVRNLKQDVKIRYFDRTSEFQRAKDLLDRYDNLSTRLSVEYIDPDKKPQVAKAESVRTYGTIFIQAGAKKEEAKSLTEEELTGALVRALKSGERTVCVVSGSGEHSLDDTQRTGYSSVKEALEKNNYKTRTVSLLGKPDEPAKPGIVKLGEAPGAAAQPGIVKLGEAPTPGAAAQPGIVKLGEAPAPGAAAGIAVPKDCTILLVGGPRYDYVEPAVNAIKAFVEGGGRALLLLDPPLKLGREETGDNAALVKVLESWGVTLNKDLVVDTSGVGQLFGLSEVVPLVTTYESHAIVREMKEVATAFPIVRSLDTKSTDKASAEKLFSTSGNSFATTNLSSQELRINPAKDKKGPLALAAAGSYNSGKEGEKGRFVVAGSSGWVSNNIIRFNGNRDLFLNMMNWLSSDEDLISIRPKEPEDRRISLNQRQMKIIFYSSVLVIPLLVVAGGLWVWWRRR
ncbi:MAG: Gldg family protein [Acidobacteria bacterium]|nr:Gldg family protein [Acidobacteriota bacterium]